MILELLMKVYLYSILFVMILKINKFPNSSKGTLPNNITNLIFPTKRLV